MYFIMRPNHYQQPIQALLLFQILIVYVEAVMQFFLSNSRQEKRRKGITVSTSKFGSFTLSSILLSPPITAQK